MTSGGPERGGIELDGEIDSGQINKTTGRSKPGHGDETKGDATAAALIAAVTRKLVISTIDNIWETDMTLPGFGSPRESCGDKRPKFCSDCGHVSMWERNCYQSECPMHANSWARRTAKRVCAKLEAARRYRQEILPRHQRFHHVVVSPPSGWDPASDSEWEAAVEIIKEMLDEANLWGYVVYHPYRGRGGDDRGAWKERLFQERDWEGDVRDELIFSPHFHVIALGHEVPGGSVTRELEAETGWILHRITKQNSNVSIYNEFDLARAVTYCLSHVGLYVDDNDNTRAATRYAGPKFQDGVKQINDVTASDELERQMDAVVRSVAPKTLNLPFNSLACGAEVPTDVFKLHGSSEKVSVARAEASRSQGTYSGGSSSGSASASSGSESSTSDYSSNLSGSAGSLRLPGSAGVLPSASGGGVSMECGCDDCDSHGHDHGSEGGDYLDALVRAATHLNTETCHGRLLGIGAAPRFLDDDEWVEQAMYAERLESTFEEWREKLDWLG